MPNVLQKRNGDDHEFLFTAADFARIRQLIYQHAGINLSQSKTHMVYSRLARRLRATGRGRFAEYIALIERDACEWQNFINALTTNLTHFYREPHHFRILSDHIKSIVGDVAHNKRTISLWCAAASTGEEAYSLAMTMVELFDSFTPPVRIVATDLDTQVLAKAQAGIYARERAERLSPAMLKRFFLAGHGEYEGFVRVRPELQALITFRPLNLLEPGWAVRGPFDAIFCRNVMIYFDKPTQYKVLQRFVPLLRPDGLLFAGHSESFHHAHDLFATRGKTVYGLAANAKQILAVKSKPKS